jgi:hypothetical protein
MFRFSQQHLEIIVRSKAEKPGFSTGLGDTVTPEKQNPPLNE